MRSSILKTLIALLFLVGWVVATPAQFKTIQTGGNRIGSVTPNGGGSFTVVGGGNDIWDQADEMTFGYTEITGDFDVKVRVESFSPNARWSKAGIMARESLSEYSRMAFTRVAPPDVPTSNGGNGVNDVAFMYRTGIQGSGLNGGTHEDRDGANSIPAPAYPNAWIKLVRIGSVFYGSNSVDGVNWQYLSSQDTTTWNGGAFKNTIYLGLAASRHSGGPTATAEFRDLAFAPVSPAAFKVIGGSSRGQKNFVWVEFNKMPGAGAATAGNYSIGGGVTVSAVTLNPANPSLVRLTTSTLTEGTTYNLTVSSVTAADGGVLTSGTASFVAGAGYEARSIMVTHSHTDNGGLYRDSQAVALGLGDIHPVVLGGGTFPGLQSNTVFEDPIPDAGNNEQFSTRVSGVLNITANGNYKFAMSSDDVGYLYLSTDDQPANKVLIANEPAWNGVREYASGGNQGSRGSPPSNISAAKALQAGKKYYMEVVFTEGGGGNNGSATWDGGTGAAFANGQSPIPAANLAAARQFGGNVFYTLGPVFVSQNPSSTTVPAGSGYGFSAKCDGTPNWDLQWYRNGVAIPGATGFSYASTAVYPADNGAQFYFVVNGPVNSATSTVATLTVTIDLTPPTLVSAHIGSGNTNIFLRFSEIMLQSSVEDQFAYTVSGATVLSATRFDGGSNVVLHTSLLPSGPGTVTINGVTDLGLGAPMPNTINPNPTVANFTVGPLLVCLPGQIQRERYNGLTPGNNVLATLFNNPKWPSAPDVLDYLNNTLGDCCDSGSDYGMRYSGHFIPPVSGNYSFEMHQDDSGRFRGSPDANANNAVTLINIDGSCCGFYPVGPIALLAGKAYYFDAVMQEGGGGDYLELRWKPPGTTSFVPVPSANLAFCYDMSITTPPAPQMVNQNAAASFSVGVSSLGAAQAPGKVRYQWERSDDGGMTWNPIANANGPTYGILPALYPADNGAKFRAVVTVAGTATTQTSAPATLTVVPDTTPPTVIEVRCSPTLTNFIVRYSELMDTNNTGDPFNYTLNGVNPTAVAVDPDLRTVRLILPQTASTLYNIIIDNVTDLVGNPITHTEISISSCIEACAGLKFETYNTGGGTAVSQLTGHPSFPNSPDSVRFMNTFDTRAELGTDNYRDNFGARLRGLFLPPASGNYIFYLHSDDAAQVFLNTNGPSAAGKILIVEETGCCNDWPARASAPRYLEEGKAYYIEGLYKEGGGGDYIRVAARLQGSADPLVAIPLNQLGQYAPANILGPVNFSPQPLSQTVTQPNTVTFTVGATVNDNFAPINIQWQRDINDGNGFQDIPGANGTTYSYGPTLVAHSGRKFRALVCTIGAKTPSAAATLTVLPDTTAPSCVSAKTTDLWNIDILFSEFMEPNSATDKFNYSIPGVNLNDPAATITLLPDGKTVRIKVAAELPTGSTIPITIQSVTDLAGLDIGTCTLPLVTPVASCGFLTFNTYEAGGGTAVSLLTSHPTYPNNPRETFYIGGFDTRLAYPDDSHDNYGGRLIGLFIPLVSGNYNFYLKSDDASQLFFNPVNSDPAGAVMIAEETGCCRNFQDVASAPQALTAGTRYFIMALYKEGGGGDYCQVAAKLDTDPTAPNLLSPISRDKLATLVSPAGANLNLTCQPASQKICLSLSGGAAQPLASENFDAGDGGFTVINNGAQPASEGWIYNAGSGTWIAAGGNGLLNSSLTSPAFTVTAAGKVRVNLSHRYSFENNDATSSWDGGQVQVSINGGSFTTVPNAAFTANGYPGSVVGTGPLQGQLAFVNDSPGYGGGNYINSSADLGAFSPGTVIRVRLLGAWDECCLGQSPSWQVNSLALTQGEGQPLAVFAVCANASIPGNANQPIYYQWQKNCGSGWVNIPGANGSSITFAAQLSDNGCRYRAQLCIPGASATTEEPLLTVVQPNTAPSFTKGPDQTVAEDSGAQSVLGFASDIHPDSVPTVTGSFQSDFTSAPVQGPSPYTANFNAGLPPGTISGGTAPPFVTPGGALRLTTVGATGQQNSWTVQSVQNIHVTDFHASWKTKLTGAGQADGWNFSVGQNLAVNGVEEEGTTTGLSVCVDTFDNGGGEVGCDIKWNGVRLPGAFVPAGAGNVNGPPELMKDVFVDASVDVDAAGNVVFKYDNFTVNGLIPGYTGIDVNQYRFGARTGGAAEGCEIDDVSISVPPFLPVAAPAGSALYGNAYLSGNVLHLTDAANGQQGSFIVDNLLGAASLGSFTMTFDALVGQGTAPPADGFAVSVGNLPNGSFGEEGAGTGLTVSFDSFDNGGGEAPAIDVIWNGMTIAHTLVPSIETGGNFVPVVIRLDPDGTLDVIAAGNTIYDNLPTGFVPIAGAKFGLGGRTGGLNENNWIDNLHITATGANAGDAEAGQSVSFQVSNDKPALFSQQPAIASDGTLTYTPAANACGQAIVTIVAVDNGGVDPECGGQDRTAPVTFRITVTPVNDCPVAGSQLVNVNEDSSVAIALVYSDVDASPNGCGNDILSVSIVTPPIHGTLSGNPPNLVYTPTPGYPSGCGHNNGADSFTYAVSDGLCTVTATVTIRVIEVNDCPHADARMASNCGIPNLVPGSLVIIAPDNTNACVVFDGTLSSDIECDTLTFAWMARVLPGAPWQFSDQARNTNCFALGTYLITLEVSDGQCAGVATLNLEVISACEAIEALINDIDGSTLERKNKRPLLASLKAACSSFDRSSFGSGENQLGAFINKVQAQIMRDNPVEGQRFINAAQAIIDGIACSRDVGDRHQNQNGNGHTDHGNGNGNGHNP